MANRFALAGLAALNLVVGFVAQWWPAAYLGVGADTDALYASLALPQLLNAVVSGGISSVLTPLLVSDNANAFRARAWASFGFVAFAGLVTTVPLALTTAWWASWLFPGFAPEMRPALVTLVRLQLLSSFFTIVLAANWATYWARHRFLWVELSGTVAGLVALGTMVAALPRYGVIAAGAALAIRAGLQVAFLLPGLGRFCRHREAGELRRLLLQRLLPPAAGSLIHRADPVVERTLASLAPVGQLSLLHLAQQLFNGANQIITKTFGNPLMTRLSEEANRHAWPEFRRHLRGHLVLAVTLATVGALLIAVVGRTGVEWLGAVSALQPADLESLYWMMLALLGTLIGGAGSQMLVIGFFAVGDTSTPTRAGVAGFAVALLGKLAVFPFLGVLGLALVASVHHLAMVVVHAALLRRGLRRREVAYQSGLDAEARS